MRSSHFVTALMLLSASTASAQFAAFDWEFDNTCGSGALADEVMSITGCDGAGGGLDAFFRSVAPYPGTAFVRVDFTNHDVFWGVDWVAWEVDGVPSQLEHNYQYWRGSLAFDVPGDTGFGLGVTSLDAQFGPGSEDLTDFHFFPEGVTLRHEFAEADADFGTAVAAFGDADDDGVPELLVGAPLSAAGRGRVLLLSGADGSVLLDIAGPGEEDAFGTAVDVLDDLDADGIPELLVGAPGDSTAGTSAGAAWVLSGADGSTLLFLTGDAPFDRFGQSVAGLGDADGDGLADLAVGAPLHDAAGNKAGQVRVHSGADGSLLLERTGDAARDELGTLVARVGDADGDLLADLLLGTPRADADGSNRGRVSVISVATGAIIQSWSGAVDEEGLGASVAGPGDLDGDGLGDVIFGSPAAALNQARAHSSGDGSLLHAWELTDWLDQGAHYGPLSTALATAFATRVGAAGDIDDDDVPDLLVRGTQRDYLYQSSPAPQVFLFAFSGRDGGLLEVFCGARGDAGYAEAFTGAGDLDGDGRADVLIGHPGVSPGLDAVETITTEVVWADLGFALPGVNGEPRLTGAGLLAVGSPLQLALGSAAPNTTSFLVVGLAAVNLPFEGGVLVPAVAPPLGVVRAFGTDGAGSWNVSTTWPSGIPAGTSLWLQSWTPDAQAVFGLSASNALRATVP